MDIQNALLRAKNSLIDENLSFVAIDSVGKIYSSSKKGVAPGLELVTNKVELCGGVIADKVVGKAAALLFVLLGVEAVYGLTVSAQAKTVLSDAGIFLQYDHLVDGIINREKNGPCPLEYAVRSTNEPNEALMLIQTTLKKLRGDAHE
ncbi:DUF1893 domain-containing protein [Clostridia bacterium]|nr:DUF1893 domain-containing protein [Clostridia bacterium]